MQITITGLYDDKPEVKEIFSQAIEYYGSLLMSKALCRNIEIDVVGRGVDEMGSKEGSCIWEDDYIRPRCFTIEVLDTMDDEDIFETVAHEMVHVKQMAKGELKERFTPVHKQTWNNKIVDTNKLSYWDLPWEIEAHGRQRGLFVRFVEAKQKQEMFGYD